MKAYLSILKKEGVKCLACAHKCVIKKGNKGICGVRSNKDGELFLDVYGSAVSASVDPMEKKPLYQFLPGTRTFSFGTLGCNFKCSFCQNHDISMPEVFSFKKNLSPELAVKNALIHGCDSISYTYNEPLVFAEYVLDTAKIAKKNGLKNILVTNGFFSEESFKEFAEVIDAVNIDLKSFNEEFYKKECKASLDPVLKTIKRFHEEKIWVEITTLIIPGLNDSEKELRSIAKFIASIDKGIPWHVSRFFPMYKQEGREITPMNKMDEAVRIGKEEGLLFVYKGNVPEPSITNCAKCGETLIERLGYKCIINFKNGKCVKCGEKLRGVL